MLAPVTYRNTTHGFILDGHNTDAEYKTLLEQYTQSQLRGESFQHQLLSTYFGSVPTRRDGAWRIHLSTLKTDFIQFTAAQATPLRLPLRPRLEHVPGSGRVTQPHLNTLPQDWRTIRWTSLRLPTEVVPINLRGQADSGVGRHRNVRLARLGAQLEALERLSTLFSGQPRVTGSFQALSRQQPVLNPAALVLPDQPLRVPYSPDLSIDWIAGVSLASGQEILVPARCVFMGYDGDPGYLMESSSGCALGNVPEEAMLYAALEIIERDAFLMTWYTRTPAPRLDLEQIPDLDALILLDDLRRQGHAVEAFDITQGNGVPAIWMMSRSHQAGHPATLTALAAHLNPVRAIRSALEELHVGLGSSQIDPEHAEALHQGTRPVQSHLDHFHYYAHPAAGAHLTFLPTLPDRHATETFLARGATWQSSDITLNLKRLTQVLLRDHPDVVFVDISAPIVSALGLSCVRAVIPDALPLTFGQAARRAATCRRLQQRLAGRPANPAPHPFP